MAHYVEFERVCIRSWDDLEMTLPEAIEWLRGHLAKVPQDLHDRTVFRAEMEYGYYEGDVDCFVSIGFFPSDDEAPRGATG
jgi:hypothetical protein